MKLAHKADYIRVFVIKKRGGIWLDSDTLVLTTTLSGSNRQVSIANYITSSQYNQFSGVVHETLTSSFEENGMIDSTTVTGSFSPIRDIRGGQSAIESASFSIKSRSGNGNTIKNLLRVSSSEDIVQLGEETDKNRFWKFKKDGRIVYSPSNTSDIFEMNLSQSFEFSKVENFGSGTKTSFTKTQGDVDAAKRVTDVTNIRLPYTKGITLTTKNGTDTIGNFGITSTDLSSSKNDINVENVIRFKGVGGYSFQNGANVTSFHIDRVGNAAFGSGVGAGDHWDASAKFHITGSKTTDIFRVSTDTDVVNVKNNEVVISGSLSVSGSIQGKTIQMTNHAYFDNSTNERNWLPFTPFGTSETNMWTSSRDNTHRFIAPHDGRLKRVMIRNNNTTTSNLGKTQIALTTFPQLTGSEEASKNVNYNTGVDFDFSQSAFSKGDLLGVYVQPAQAPYYVNITCVWEYDTRN